MCSMICSRMSKLGLGVHCNAVCNLHWNTLCVTLMFFSSIILKSPKKCDFLLCPAHLTHWLSAKGTKAEFWRQRKAPKLLVQYIWSGRSAVCVRLVIGGEERAAVHPPTSYHAPLRSHSQLHTTPNFFSIQPHCTLYSGDWYAERWGKTSLVYSKVTIRN